MEELTKIFKWWLLFILGVFISFIMGSFLLWSVTTDIKFESISKAYAFFLSFTIYLIRVSLQVYYYFLSIAIYLTKASLHIFIFYATYVAIKMDEFDFIDVLYAILGSTMINLFIHF